MKIGILTLPLQNNYGGNLQAFALQTYLKKLGHDAYLINLRSYRPNYVWLIYMDIKGIFKKYSQKNSPHFFQGTIDAIKNQYAFYVISKHTRVFLNKMLKPITYGIPSYLSEKKYPLVMRYQFDALVVGSDQVWRPDYTANIEDYFFGFLPKSSSIKRISYAASFGVDQLAFTQTQTERCAELLSRFDAVSVRESSALALCKDHFNVDATHLVDPTMLIHPEEYKEMIEREFQKDVDENTGLITYILDANDTVMRLVEIVESSLNQAHKKVNNPLMGDESVSINERVAPPLENWLHAFACAEFIISDSFHACVFAIIFNKPFITLGNEKRGLARFNSLLTMFNLESRLLTTPDNAKIKELINTKIDWGIVNKLLDIERKKSYDFLVSALKIYS